MSIDVECPGCRAGLQVPDRLAGKRVRCTTCREEFRVGGEEPTDDYDDEPRPRRRRATSTSSPLVSLLIVGGIVAGCLVVAVVAVVLIARSMNDAEPAQPFAAPGQVPPNVKRAGLGRPGQNAAQPVVAQHTVSALRPSGRLGRPAKPPDGPMVVTLSNPRRAGNGFMGRPVYQLDYQTQDVPAGDSNRYYLIVDGPGGIGEAHLLMLAIKPSGTVNFDFFTGFDPGQGFDMWVEREPFGKPAQRKKVSIAVTLK